MKYPRTFHLPWSPGATNDDKIIKSITCFEDKEVVVTEKLDGENTTLTQKECYARSLDSKHHASRNYVKSLWGKIAYRIKDEYRLHGENVYAQHSIIYSSLPDYFILFGVSNQEKFLSWDETINIAKELGLKIVPTLYQGTWDIDKIKACLSKTSKFTGEQEGYVVRNIKSFKVRDFSNNVAKYVRKNHIQTSEHWMYQEIKKNGLIL